MQRTLSVRGVLKETDRGSVVRTLIAKLQQLSPSETQVLVASGLIVGVGSGLGAIAFRYLIEWFSYFFFDFLQPALATYFGDYAVIFIPALGGLVFGPLIYFFAREAKGHGVPEVMFAVTMGGGRIRSSVAVIKSVASALCIGSGGSVGREGPIVQVGAALGSSFGQIFRMSEARIRILVACGAAGGIAATFNAPIAGVFFALEVILGEFTTRAFGTVVISSVTAAVLGQAVFGDVAAFPVPEHDLESVFELPLYAILAVLAALVGIAFTQILYRFEDGFDAIPMLDYLKPVPGGLMLGTLGLFVPQIFGVGYPAMESALAGEYGFGLLAGLIVAKILAVSLTIGSGGSGGVFAPSLFIGAMLGTAFGTVVNEFFPGTTADPAAYGLVGMAAVFAGAAHAPITAVIILFEITGDYAIILPLMGAVVISTLVSEALNRDSIYTLKLRRRGVDLRTGRSADLMRTIKVSDAMVSEVTVMPCETSVAEASNYFSQSQDRSIVLLDENAEIAGIVTTQDVEEALLESKPGLTLRSIATEPVVTIFPDQSLSHAMRQMGVRDLRQLPVVERSNPKHPIGILRRNDIVRAYGQAMLRRMEEERQDVVHPSELRGTQVVEATINARSPVAGVRIADLDLPHGALMIAVEREGSTIIPHGETQLARGDRMMLLVRSDHVADVHDYLASKSLEEKRTDEEPTST